MIVCMYVCSELLCYDMLCFVLVWYGVVCMACMA